ncbi:MAG: hypothetical protein A2X66_08765 [Ignavibacteria bacterium GWA2_54_16]|nr:MAG: hypothetical protein A2X66_08765 [Ignavibacteria bacterium GWA2_54_16]
MKSHTTRLVTLIFCVVLLGVSVVTAQNPRVGGVAAPELLIPAGARDLALGGSSLAVTKGVEAMYWNPAGLGRMPGSAEAMVSSLSYIADINVTYGAVAGRFGDFGAVGISIKSLNFGDIPLTSEEDPEGRSGRFYSPTYITMGASFARDLTDAVTVGFTAKLISEQIDRVSSSGFAFDFGIQYKGLIQVEGLGIGLAIKNIGPGMKFDGPALYRNAVITDGSRPTQKYKAEAATFELPATVDIGLTYERSLGDNLFASVSGAFVNNNLYYDEYRGGLELGFDMEGLQLVGRVGYLNQPKAEDNVFGATAGFGISYKTGNSSITVDYGYRQVQYFKANNVFSVKLDF